MRIRLSVGLLFLILLIVLLSSCSIFNRMIGERVRKPEVDFVGLARSFGVAAHQVTEPDELSERMHESLNQTEPTLLDVSIER